MTLDINEIQQILPHRPPMLLVDRIVDLIPFKSATGIKCVTMNESFFLGGVTMLYPDEHRGKIALFGGMENVKFKRPVVPGDVVVTKAELVRVRGVFGVLHADAYVNDELVAAADFKFALKNGDEI